MKTLVLIPAKDEAEKIGSVAAEVRSFGYDLLVVDDGSCDKTAEAAVAAGATVLRHAINRGQGAALKTGIEYAAKKGYGAVVLFDADGQMKASEISMMMMPIASGEAEVALGSRFLGKAVGIPMAKKITLKLALAFTRFMTGLKLTDVHNGFQAWNMEALKKINLSQDRQAYASEILSEIGKRKIRFREVPVTISYSAYSKAKGQSIFNAINILWDLFIKR